LSVDPDNRLVADNLEADWNDSLRQLQTAQDDYQRAADAAQAALTDQHQARIRRLATDFPALWSDPATPQRERKRMVRLLIEDVTLTRTDHIGCHVRFRGGQTTTLTIAIPPKAWEARRTDPEALALLDRLLDDHTDGETAELLNTGGHRSGTGQAFTPSIVLHLRRSNNLPSHLERLRARGMLDKHEVADRLGVHVSTIKAWNRAGLLISHKANDKNIRLFEPPTPGDPRLVKKMGSSLARRASNQPSLRGAI
jgi:DNA-binding transcriptional regulator YiaG